MLVWDCQRISISIDVPDEHSKGQPVVRRLLILVMLASLLLAACDSAATPAPTAAPTTASKPAAAASPAGSPAASASPSPSPAAAAASGGGGSTWARIRDSLTSDLTLVVIGVLLSIGVVAAWMMSNRAEATPNEDQRAEMRNFVNDHFAKYVARGLVAEGIGPVAISRDPAWRRVYIQHLRLHNELYAFRKDIALSLFDTYIDEAVRRELEAARASGQQSNPVVTPSG